MGNILGELTLKRKVDIKPSVYWQNLFPEEDQISKNEKIEDKIKKWSTAS